MTELAVIGNISRVKSCYQGGRTCEFVGGGAFHVALASASAGILTSPISLVGTDLRWLWNVPLSSNLDLSFVDVLRGESSRFEITYDAEGAVKEIECRYGVATDLVLHARQLIGRHKQYHVCCRQPLSPEDVLADLVRTKVSFSVDFYVSSAVEMIARCVPFLPHANACFFNSREYELLCNHLEPDCLECVVVSDGSRAVHIFRYGKQVARILPRAMTPLEVTGAGDTLAGTLIAAWWHGFDDVTAGRMAIDAATSSLAGPALPIPKVVP